jgi:adenine phosphoribosyltransferase
MEYSYYEQFINKNTKLKYDLTPLCADKDVFQSLITDLAKPFKGYDVVIGQESVGFILGSAVALYAKKAFVPIRKQGKLPTFRRFITRISFVDYSKTKKGFEMNKHQIKHGQRILLVDDWIETGGQMKAAIKLIEKQGGIVIGIAAIGVMKNKKTQVLFDKYNCRPIKVFE